MTGSAHVTVRLSAPADIPAMGRLFEEAFDEPYGAVAVEDLLKPPSAWALVAEADFGDGPTPVGFLIAGSAADETEILSVGTSARYRRMGVGNALINFLLHVARSKTTTKIFLEVADDNAAAVALYAAAGFERVGFRRNYYKRRGGITVDALILKRDLS